MLQINHDNGALSFQNEFSTVRGRAVSVFCIMRQFIWLAAKFDSGTTLPKQIDGTSLELAGSGSEGWAVYADPAKIDYSKPATDAQPLIFGDHQNGLFAATCFLYWVVSNAGGMPDPNFLDAARRGIHRAIAAGKTSERGVEICENYLRNGPKGILVRGADPRRIYSSLFAKYCDKKKNQSK